MNAKHWLLAMAAATLLFPLACPCWAQSKVIPVGHVRELQAYLDAVEIYAPIRCRNLAVYPVRLRGGTTLGGSWLTMDEALRRGELIVSEQRGGGRVPVVSMENRSRSHHIFIMAGEILAGGKQTRTLRQDVVLSPGERINVKVFCVEEHRWRGDEKFMAGESLVPQSIHKQLRKGADQASIWDEVSRNNRALGAENATGSLLLALKSEKVARELSDIRSQIMPEVPRDAVGFVFLHGRQAVAAEFFGRPEVARVLLPKLVDAYAVDFVLQQKGRAPVHPSPDNVAIRFFQQVQRSRSHHVDTPGSGSGIQTRTRSLIGEGVSLAERLVHYGVQIEDRVLPLR